MFSDFIKKAINVGRRSPAFFLILIYVLNIEGTTNNLPFNNTHWYLTNSIKVLDHSKRNEKILKTGTIIKIINSHQKNRDEVFMEIEIEGKRYFTSKKNFYGWKPHFFKDKATQQLNAKTSTEDEDWKDIDQKYLIKKDSEIRNKNIEKTITLIDEANREIKGQVVDCSTRGKKNKFQIPINDDSWDMNKAYYFLLKTNFCSLLNEHLKNNTFEKLIYDFYSEMGVNSKAKTPASNPTENITDIVFHHGGDKMSEDKSLNEIYHDHIHNENLDQYCIAYQYCVGGTVDGLEESEEDLLNTKISRTRPCYMVGSHISGKNRKKIGVCVINDLSKNIPSPEQVYLLGILSVYLEVKYPKARWAHHGTNTYSKSSKSLCKTKLPDGTKVESHGFLYKYECPGQNGMILTSALESRQKREPCILGKEEAKKLEKIDF